MGDEVALAEVVRRLVRLESLLQELSLRLVSTDIYTRDQREVERRFTELERDLAEERTARRSDVTEIKARFDSQGTNWRQAIYSGILPAILFLVGILLQLKGGK